ncbi:MAG: hypothetical protein EPO07_00415 [Verrucomicrobia bacterium]|nr:MAG: hypothetical protein EPO07_00415 [Verrucomicrobiota bacterium]
MNIPLTQRVREIITGGTILPLVEWNDGESFPVVIRQETGLAVRHKLKRIQYAELVAGISGRRVTGRIAGL